MSHKRKLWVLILLFLNISGIVYSQSNDTNNWRTLGKVTFKKEYDEMLGYKVDVPIFGKDVIAIEGKMITIKGYIIPVQGYKSHTEFVFSAFPYNMCYFCGGAGPETVIEVQAKDPIKYTTDPITIKGKLHLNRNDVNSLMYSLSDVVKIN
ncbi:MAG: hypothetical protein KA010_00070 [Saprospiraceae bacterium]|nr:hypothetical protein [Saprospiraceae bacterium]